MEQKKIIMNYTVPPSSDDLSVMAHAVIDGIPEELSEYCENIAVVVEELPDDATQSDYDLDDPYEMLALFRSGKEMSPGIVSKSSKDDDVLVLYRRAILDLWCENGEDIAAIMRDVIIEEIAKTHDFTSDEIDEMTQRHYQGML